MSSSPQPSRFKRATRRKARLRMALDGPAGSGKSFTALRFAFALGARVAVIDTENGSASLYQGLKPDDRPFDFEVLELHSYAPTEYTQAIEDAGREKFDVLVIDSLSHAWSGKDGALEIKDKQGGNQFAAWRNVTPMHNRMVEAILQSPCHVIATMRSKTEYVMEKDENGKTVPRKVGLAPVQRAGMEYEFTIYGSMDWTHLLTVSKSRCPAVEGAIVVKPGASFMVPVINWLEHGEAAPPADLPRRVGQPQLDRLGELVRHLGTPFEKLRDSLKQKYGVGEFRSLTEEQANEVEARMKESLARKQQAAANSAARN